MEVLSEARTHPPPVTDTLQKPAGDKRISDYGWQRNKKSTVATRKVPPVKEKFATNLTQTSKQLFFLLSVYYLIFTIFVL